MHLTSRDGVASLCSEVQGGVLVLGFSPAPTSPFHLFLQLRLEPRQAASLSQLAFHISHSGSCPLGP